MAMADDDKFYLFASPTIIFFVSVVLFPAVAALLRRRRWWLWFCTGLWLYAIFDFAVDAAGIVELSGHSIETLRREYGIGLPLPLSFLRHGGLSPLATAVTVQLLARRLPRVWPVLYFAGLLAALGAFILGAYVVTRVV